MTDDGAATREIWRAPAKINLWLEITGRRPDGYHTVDTCYQAIDLADTVILEPADRPGVSCVVKGPFAEGVPEGPDNLAVRAALLLAERTGHDPRVTITVVKEIPAGAGLGGGSSDAAAVLVALAQRFAVPDPDDTLVELAAELGADVPFFLKGGTQRATGIGDRLRPVDPPDERWGILVWPGVPVSTRWAYEAYDRAVDAADPPRARPAPGPPHPDWRTRGNAFESVVLDEHPVVDRVLELFRTKGGSTARVSGSGAAVYALFGSETERGARLSDVRDGIGSWARARSWSFEFIDHGVRRRDRLFVEPAP